MGAMLDVCGNKAFNPQDLADLSAAYDGILAKVGHLCQGVTGDVWRDYIARIVLFHASEGYEDDGLTERPRLGVADPVPGLHQA